MKLKLYQVDAFTDRVFAGNPAAVCPLDRWLADHLMQNIAMENNLAETAFFVRNGDRFEIRWFTPTIEIDLCGHATLASAFVLFNIEGFSGDTIEFHSHRSGSLRVTREEALLTLDFPTDQYSKVPLTDDLKSGFDVAPVEAYKGRSDYLLVFDSEEQVANLRPDFSLIRKIKARGVIATARGNEVDFVSRFFGPQSGIDEDPVTGSAHTTLTPFWYERTGKKTMSARQLSSRGGTLTCTFDHDRVRISGNARLYLTGEIEVE
jgi:PhzF family phenazine biosynthesis protein